MSSLMHLYRFTGTAGTAVVTTDQALLWTDGRYFLQVTGNVYVVFPAGDSCPLILPSTTGAYPLSTL